MEIRNQLDSVAAFLYAEARMLDRNDLVPWLELFDEDGSYCAPLASEYRPGEPVVLVDDDRLRRQRVFRLLATPAYAQRPASRTVRQVSNIEVRQDEDGLLAVDSVLVIHELRVGDERQFGLGLPRQLAARCNYRLKDVEGTLRILKKEVILLLRESRIENLSIML